MRTSLFGIGLRGQSRAVTAKRAKNFYFEVRPEDERVRIVAYGFPGRALFTDFGDTPIRGMYAQGDYLYVVHRGTFWEVNNAGVKTSRGTLNTVEGRVSIISNGPQIMVVDGEAGYLYKVADHTFAEITAAGFFSNPVTVTFQDGYFICSFADSGRFQISGLYDGESWDALDFANAESSPDNLMAAIADHGEVCLFGESTSEFWGNTGAEDFPYSNIRGASIERGLAARWSLCKFNDALAFLGKNAQGQVQVYMLRGHTPVPISTPDLDSIINQYPAVADATAMSFNWFGHPFYIINFPSANASWLYDGSTGFWSELEENEGRWLGEIHADYINQPRVSDAETGRIYTISPDAYTNNGESIVGEIIGETVMAPDGERFTVNCIRLEMETGVGVVSGQGSNPQVMLQVSRDDGYTWGNELWRSVGKIGQYGRRVEWRRMGTADRLTPKLRITDPCKRVILGAVLNPSD